jgi:transposase
MTTHKVQVAQELYSSGQYTVAAIAKTLGVSRASIYRHVARYPRTASERLHSNTDRSGIGQARAAKKPG